MTTRAARTKITALADKITPDDMARHQLMLFKYQEAERLMQEAQRFQARANQLVAAFSVWAEELHERYNLDAAMGEGVEPDGRITRRTLSD